MFVFSLYVVWKDAHKILHTHQQKSLLPVQIRSNSVKTYEAQLVWNCSEELIQGQLELMGMFPLTSMCFEVCHV